MSEPTIPADVAALQESEDQAIRQRVKGLTSQALQQGRIDPEAVRDVCRAVIGRMPGNPAVSSADARQLFADAVREVDEALVKSASAAHGALQQLASRGKDFTENDLKEALVSLRKLEESYAAAADRVAEAIHAQNVGAAVSAPVTSMMGDYASAVGAIPGFATLRGASARFALLASGVLAGISEALNEEPEAKKGQ